MSEREPLSFPTNHISREDLIYVSPDRESSINALSDGQMKQIANEIGESMSEEFWVATSIVLDRHVASASEFIPDTREQTIQGAERVREHDQTPEQLLALKDAILTAFNALPPEHQATMSLVIVGRIMEGEWGDWLQDALNHLYPSNEIAGTSPLQFPIVTREQLQQTSINPEDVDTLTDDDLATITTNMHSHYINDLFWDELQFHTENLLGTKRSAADSTNADPSLTSDTTG
ncbi:MAG: hypothetical protein KF716_20045 [Anaerolineae bacterium]|nr:hypothetical protein [Anaerolineae bacterium]